MKLVYTHEKIALVQNASNLLENNGIKTVLRNEFSSGAAGGLVPAETWPEVCLLDNNDYDKAIELLKTLTAVVDKPDWKCDNCAELNGAMFESCWNCQTNK